MRFNSLDNYDIVKFNEFDRIMIEAAKNNEEIFVFDNEKYYIYSDGVIVQTLINDRILYRIYVDEEKNDESVHYELMDYLENTSTIPQ